MPVSEAQKRATAKYERDNYDKVLVRFPKGTKERIKDTGADSVNGYIIKCVLNALDGSQNAEETVNTEDTKKAPEAKKTPEISELYEIYKSKLHEFVTQLEIQEKYGNDVLLQLSEYRRRAKSADRVQEEGY